MRFHFFVQSSDKQGTFFRYHNFAKGLTKLGHTVVVFSAVYSNDRKPIIESIDGVEYQNINCYYRFQSKLGQWSHPFAALKRCFASYGYCDVSILFQPHLSAFLPWYFNRKQSKCNVFDWDDLWAGGLLVDRGSFFNNWNFIQASFIERSAPIVADKVITCSKYLLDSLPRNIDSKNKICVPNGFWSEAIPDKYAARYFLGLHQSVKYIGFMGRTIDEIEWCFQLLRHLLSISQEVRLALCGMPREVIDSIDVELKSRIDYLGVLNPADAKKFSAAIDIGLLPLQNNSFNLSRFPIKFAEYLSTCTPVLTTDVGECSIFGRRYPFVYISESEVNNWCKRGAEMFYDLTTGKLPRVSKDKIYSELSWNEIVEKLHFFFTAQLERGDSRSVSN